MTKDRLLGGLYGALIGDACGVPYEFKSKNRLPKYEDIDMVPPVDYKRTWSDIPVGTYSDDGAQLLCLLEVLLTTGSDFSEAHLKQVLRNWMYRGYMSVDNNTFDVGNQTGAALRTDDVSPLDKLQFNGNGSLMRCLPAALCFEDPVIVANVAWNQSGITHPHALSRLCCVVYCLTARGMLNGQSTGAAFDAAMVTASSYDNDIFNIIKEFEFVEHKGSGFVVDSLWSSIDAVRNSTSYEDAIKLAISYGNDTDTTACIAGGLAGIKYGKSGIPQRWLDLLRGQTAITALADRLIETV